MNYPDRKRGRMSPEERASIAALAERGLRPGQIALKLNRHPATVNFAMHSMGLNTLRPRTFEYLRGGRTVRSFSPAEDRMIQELRAAGLSTLVVAARLNEAFGNERSCHTVGVRLKMLANLDDEAA